jgi:iron only hydrogenase large subunit-like protein
MTLSKELNRLKKLLKDGEKLAAMLAPSFPIDFSYPEIVGKLKRAGFSYVLEVARGAVDTNTQVVKDLKENPGKRIITSPCPTCVNYIKTKRPDLKKFLSTADSPMAATAKLLKDKFSDAKPVFIGPCLTKKLEAQNLTDLNILAITYKELDSFLKDLNLKDSTEDLTARFDLSEEKTRLYPISGGLCQSAGVNELLADDQFQMVSGLENLDRALDEFLNNKNIRLLDILFCDGGCINGPGIISQESIEKRRHKIIKFWSIHLN